MLRTPLRFSQIQWTQSSREKLKCPPILASQATPFYITLSKTHYFDRNWKLQSHSHHTVKCFVHHILVSVWNSESLSRVSSILNQGKLVQSSCNIYLVQLERDLVTEKMTTQAEDHFQQLLPKTKSNCGNHVNPRNVRQSTNSYKRHIQMWFLFSHLNCNELEKTTWWWWWRVSYSQMKDTKLLSLLAVTIHWRQVTFNCTPHFWTDFLTLGEARGRHQEAVEGGGRTRRQSATKTGKAAAMGAAGENHP